MVAYTERRSVDTWFSGGYNEFLSIYPSTEVIENGLVNGYDKRWTNLGKICTNIEKSLNYLSHVTLVSNVSSVCRVVFSLVITISSIVLTIFSAIRWLVYGDILSKSEMNQWAKYTAHGFINIFRAAVEFIPVVGSFICNGYDYFGYRLEY